MLHKVFCSNIAPSLSSGNHLFYKAEKKIDADIEGCNDNYDDNYGNCDDNYDKND